MALTPMGRRFIQVLAWIVALLVPSAISIWPYLKQSNKSLEYRILAVTPIGPTQAVGFGNLRLLHGDKPVEAPYLVAVKITNTGDVDIRLAVC